MSGSSADLGFALIWPSVEPVPGWLTKDQAAELVRLATSTPQARVVEIGSHQGRSTVALALSSRDVHVTAIDPFITGRLFEGPRIRERLLDNLARAGVSGRVTLLTTTSRKAYATWPSSPPLTLAYVDGKHDAVSLIMDLRWATRVREGGHVAVHDMFSSIGVTAGALLALPLSRRLALSHRVGSLAILDVRAPSLRDRLRPFTHVPWFLRNVLIKVCLRLGLTRLTARLGHTDQFDPY